MSVDWQARYEANETPWDRGGPAPGLTAWLKNHRMHGRVLVPGCGHGHDLTALAGSGAEAVVGLDIAPAAVALAGERCAGLPGVSVLEGDLFAMATGPLRGSFDWIFEHTCYCAIPRERRPDYVAAVHAALRPGGHLLAVFYLQPWDAHEDQDQGPPFGTGTESLDAMFADRFALMERWQPTVAYTGREGREEMRLLRRCP